MYDDTHQNAQTLEILRLLLYAALQLVQHQAVARYRVDRSTCCVLVLVGVMFADDDERTARLTVGCVLLMLLLVLSAGGSEMLLLMLRRV